MAEPCYVYWIKTEDMTDVRKEGYIGVSSDPVSREKQHRANARSGGYRINSDLKTHLLTGTYVLEVIASGSRAYCLWLEKELRPERVVGWNIAVGGKDTLSGANDTHRASHRKEYALYHNLASKSDGIIPEWQGDEGVLAFIDWVRQVKGEESSSEVFTIIYPWSPLAPWNIEYGTRSEILRRSQPQLFSYETGDSLSTAEWADELQVKPNTITTRLRRGWSVDEALGFINRTTGETMQDTLEKYYLGVF